MIPPVAASNEPVGDEGPANRSANTTSHQDTKHVFECFPLYMHTRFNRWAALIVDTFRDFVCGIGERTFYDWRDKAGR